MRRVYITSDIGGSDPDDQQSFVHMLHYYNEFNLVGFGVGVPRGRIEVAYEVIRAAEADGHKYPGIRAKIVEGATKPGVGALSRAAADIITSVVEAPEERLYVLCWGAPTDLAIALKHEPFIAKNINAFVLGDWNVDKDREAFEFIKKAKGLSLVVCLSTFRGMYLGAPAKGKWSNAGFVKQVIQPSGHLGEYFYKISKTINTGAYSLKMGDTPALLWALKSSELNLGIGTWGGTYRRKPGENYWFDTPNPAAKLGSFNGARTVAKYRMAILKDWEAKIDAYKKGK